MSAVNQPGREKEIFEEAIDRPTMEERLAYAKSACGGDAELLQQVQSLLQAYDKMDGFLPERPVASASPVLVEIADKPGSVIGHYKLLQIIGEGGCGTVYMAEQQEPVRRQVALKIIKLGMDTKAVIARFEVERQALAMMDHPNIARVFDAGATTTGRPYFVMELVRGVPITAYCDEHSLPMEERLNLFMQVCHAIQHAHQKGIIHRDIKPSNIIVTLHDGVPVPKVIDFGIAKATLGQLTNRTLFTAIEQFIGTPAYMSPEQAELSGLDIDTRSDIYSLGVLLYELLTGKSPFDSRTLIQAGLDEIRRQIREVEPPKPSTRLSTLGNDDRVATAKLRGTDPVKLSLLIRGDLDWIVMKALEKNRTRRYETAGAMAADIRRHLQNEPVTAHPPGRGYRLQKLVSRNRLLFAAGSAVMVALVLGLALSTWAFVKEKAARQRAVAAEAEQSRARAQAELARNAEAKQRALAEANAIKARSEAAKSGEAFKFMGGMLAGVGPSVAAGRDTALLREILDNTIRRLDSTMKDQPEVGIKIRSKLAAVYLDLGELAKGEALASETLASSEQIYGHKGEDVALALQTLATARLMRLQGAESEALARDALALFQQLPGQPSERIGPVLVLLGMALSQQGKMPEAETALREALTMARDYPNAEDLPVDSVLTKLASVLQKKGRFGEAEPMLREALDLQEKRFGRGHPITGYSMAELSKVLMGQGKYPEAESLMNDALGVLEKSLGHEHPSLWDIRRNQAFIAMYLLKRAEAQQILEDLIALQSKVLGREHPDVLQSRAWLVDVLKQQQKIAEADAQEKQMLADQLKTAGSEEMNAAERKAYAAAMAQQKGEWPEVEALLRSALPVFERTKGRAHPATIVYREVLARAFFGQKRLAEAEALNREILADCQQAYGDQSTYVVTALFNLGRGLYQQGKLGESEDCFRRALAISKTQTTDSVNTLVADSLLILATLRDRLGDVTEASALIREAVATSNKLPPSQRGAVYNVLNPVIMALLQENKLAEAEAMQRILRKFALDRDGPDCILDASLSVYLAKTLVREGRFSEAEPLVQKGLELRKKFFSATVIWSIPEAQGVLGEIQLGTGRLPEAEASLTAAFAAMLQNPPKGPNPQMQFYRTRLREIAGLLVKLYEQTNQPAKAGAWQQKVDEFTVPASSSQSQDSR
jgi:serine/threonine protein kinase/tetratricopeptide (TPR) repeat protein